MNKVTRSIAAFVLASSMTGSLLVQTASAEVASTMTYCLISSCEYKSNWSTTVQDTVKIAFNTKNAGFTLTKKPNQYFIEKINTKTGVSSIVSSVNLNLSTAQAEQYATMESFQMSGDTIYTAGIANPATNTFRLYYYNTVTDQSGYVEKNLKKISGYTFGGDSSLKLDANGFVYAMFKKDATKHRVIKFDTKLNVLYSRDMKLDDIKAWDVDQEGNIYFANNGKYVRVLSVNDNYASIATRMYKTNKDSSFKAVELYASDTNNPSDIFVVYEKNGKQTLKLINQTDNKVSEINLNTYVSEGVRKDTTIYKLYPTSWDKKLVILSKDTTDASNTVTLYRSESEHKITKLFSQNNVSTLPTFVKRDFAADIYMLNGKNIAKVDVRKEATVVNSPELE